LTRDDAYWDAPGPPAVITLQHSQYKTDSCSVRLCSDSPLVPFFSAYPPPNMIWPQACFAGELPPRTRPLLGFRMPSEYVFILSYLPFVLNGRQVLPPEPSYLPGMPACIPCCAPASAVTAPFVGAPSYFSNFYSATVAPPCARCVSTAVCPHVFSHLYRVLPLALV